MADNSNKSSTPITLIFFGLLSFGVYTNRVSVYVLGFYAALSLYTFFIYAKDKSAAKKGKWRTPEQTFHVYSLFCGWPGALLAHQWLRHKSQKKSFRTVFWITVILNVGILLWLHSPHGINLINSIIK